MMRFCWLYSLTILWLGVSGLTFASPKVLKNYSPAKYSLAPVSTKQLERSDLKRFRFYKKGNAAAGRSCLLHYPKGVKLKTRQLSKRHRSQRLKMFRTYASTSLLLSDAQESFQPKLGSKLVKSSGALRKLVKNRRVLKKLSKGSKSFGKVFRGLGSLGVGVSSAVQLIRAKKTTKKVDAAHGVAWGLQSLVGMAYATKDKFSAATRMTLKKTGQLLGVAGGILQSGVGAYRLTKGIKEHDKEKIVLGGLDAGAGVAWTASALWGGPISMGACVGLNLVSLGYSYRDDIRKTKDRLKRAAYRLFHQK